MEICSELAIDVNDLQYNPIPGTRRVSVLTEQVHAFVDHFAEALELIGVAIILGGIILATVVFLRDASRTNDWRSAYPRYRSDIGRGTRT